MKVVSARKLDAFWRQVGLTKLPISNEGGVYQERGSSGWEEESTCQIRVWRTLFEGESELDRKEEPSEEYIKHDDEGGVDRESGCVPEMGQSDEAPHLK